MPGPALPGSGMRRWAALPLLLALQPAWLPAWAPAHAQAAPVTHEPVEDAAATILGRQVLDPAGHPAGRIVDVLVDELGNVRAAVVDFGGFMGVGQRRVAIAWRALHFRPADGGVVLEMSAEGIAAAPEYKPGAPIVTAAPPPLPTPAGPKE